jgi:hypothetical protein
MKTRGGEVRNSSKARPVRPAGQTKTKIKIKVKVKPETVSSACGLHLPRRAWHTTAQTRTARRRKAARRTLGLRGSACGVPPATRHTATANGQAARIS